MNGGLLDGPSVPPGLPSRKNQAQAIFDRRMRAAVCSTAARSKPLPRLTSIFSRPTWVIIPS
jgi:hypothetical protein